MNHSHQLLQRLSLEFAHGKDPLVQPRAGARPQGFLKANTHHISSVGFDFCDLLRQE